MNVFYILVMDKNHHPDTWYITQWDSHKARLEVLTSQADGIVGRLPKARYPGVQNSVRKLTNSHSGAMEVAYIYEISKIN